MRITQETEAAVTDLLNAMTDEEKVALCHADSLFTVPGVPRLGIGEVVMSDGPHGVRPEFERDDFVFLDRPEDACTYQPTGTALAATWDPALARRFGEMLGSEARARGKDIILGPGINIIRNPLCGRNFEYMSEDPCLISGLVPEVVQGIESQDVAACVKHFALNNQELDRLEVDVEVSRRALHEIYLKGFYAAVTAGGASTVMGAYNQYEGTHCCHHDYLLNEVLKRRWGFAGAVISDWGGARDGEQAIFGGLDIEMCTSCAGYDAYFLADAFLKRVKTDPAARAALEDKARRILRVIFSVRKTDPARLTGEFNTPAHQQTAYDIAAGSMILLKNEGGLLPLSGGGTLLVTGPNADRQHADGGFSSGIRALYEITPLAGIRDRLGDRFAVEYLPDDAPDLLTRAAEAAYVIYCGGLSHADDTEAYDRKHMDLPGDQNARIAALLAVNPRTVTVLTAGSPVTMPWIAAAPAVVWTWYAGMEGGHVLADILSGAVCPSGKLPFTLPRAYADTPVARYGEYREGHCRYNEGMLVGYRGFDADGIEPLFPFGHGLSYATFTYADLSLTAAEDGMTVAFTVTAAVPFDGAAAETAQVYCGKPDRPGDPPKALRAFRKVFLHDGESTRVTLTVTREELSVFDEATEAWRFDPGCYTVSVGASSRDIRLTGTVTVAAVN